MEKRTEDLKSLEKLELIYPAKDLLDAITVAADALSKEPLDKERAKNLRLVLGFLNAYIRAFNTKVGYIKLTMVPKELKASMKKKFWKFK